MSFESNISGSSSMKEEISQVSPPCENCEEYERVSSSPSRKIKKPRRLRKQINNDQFKQFYFELKVNDSSKKLNNQSTLLESSKSEMKSNESYEILQFETVQDKDEEALYQERIKNEIKANSHHFCLSPVKKKRNVTNQHDIKQCSSDNTTSSNHDEFQMTCITNTITTQPTPNYDSTLPILYHQRIQPVTYQTSNENTELLKTILQLLIYNNKN